MEDTDTIECSVIVTHHGHLTIWPPGRDQLSFYFMEWGWLPDKTLPQRVQAKNPSKMTFTGAEIRALEELRAKLKSGANLSLEELNAKLKSGGEM